MILNSTRKSLKISLANIILKKHLAGIKNETKKVVKKARLVRRKIISIGDNKRFKEIVIHIGLHKTGTTTIQNAFFSHREELESREGILYPSLSQNHSIPLYSMFCDKPECYHINIRNNVIRPEEVKKLNDRHTKAIEKEIDQSTANRLLLSGEDLSVLSLEGVSRFKDWLMKYSDNIRVIAWLREPVEWSASTAQHTIRNGTATISAVMKKPPVPNYRGKLEKYFNIFGQQKVEIVDFHQAASHHEGIIGKFCDHLNIKNTMRKKLLGCPSRNISISYEAALVISKINEKFPMFTDGRLTPGRVTNDIVPFANIKGSKFMLSDEAAQIVLEKEKSSLNWLKDNCGFSFKQCDNLSIPDPALSSDEILTSLSVPIFRELQKLNANLWLERGRVSLLQEKYKTALKQLEKSIAFVPDLSEAHFNLSLAKRYLGLHEEAFISAKEAVRLKPDETRYIDHLRTFQDVSIEQ